MIQLIKVTDTSNDVTNSADGFLQNVEGGGTSVTLTITPYGQFYPAGLVTTSAPNQLAGVKIPIPTESFAQTYTGLAATNVDSNGSSGVFSAKFEDVSGTIQLTELKATTAGLNYLVRDQLSVTTSGPEIAVGKRIASFTTISTVTGTEGFDTALTITPTSSGAGTGAKTLIQVETGGTITDSATYVTLTLGADNVVGDILTFNANDNDEGNVYADPWEFTVTLAAGDLSGGNTIIFALLDGANDTTTSVTLADGNHTEFPVKKYKVDGTTDRKIAVYKSVPPR